MSVLALRDTRASPRCPEHALVALVRAGDDRAFEELYSRYRKPIGRYVLRMVGDHGRAEDVTQEVFISALRRIRCSERPIDFKPWIYEVAKNACIDQFRRTRRAPEIPLEVDDSTPIKPHPALAVSATPDVTVEGKQQLADLRGAFNGLSETQHRILVLRELEGRSYDEIGASLGLSRQVVQSTLFRARRRLTQEYDEIASGRRCESVRAVVAGDPESSMRVLGVREKRRVARHLSHCQRCRRDARLAGFEHSRLQLPSIAARIAGLLPFPLLRGRGGRGGAENGDGVARAALHRLAETHSVQAVAQLADTGTSAVFGRAAAAVAALVIAGAGGGVATTIISGQGATKASAPRHSGVPSRGGSGLSSPRDPGAIGRGHNVRSVALQGSKPPGPCRPGACSPALSRGSSPVSSPGAGGAPPAGYSGPAPGTTPSGGNASAGGSAGGADPGTHGGSAATGSSGGSGGVGTLTGSSTPTDSIPPKGSGTPTSSSSPTGLTNSIGLPPLPQAPPAPLPELPQLPAVDPSSLAVSPAMAQPQQGLAGGDE